jgi:hypothetical protein
MREGQHRPDRRHADGPVVGMTGARFGGSAGRRLRQAAQGNATDPVPDASPDPGQLPDQDQPIVGRTGARFPSPVTRRVRGGSEPPGPGQPAQLLPAPPAPEVAPAPAANQDDWSVDESEWELPEETFGLVRPYTWTGGRTTSGQQLAMEALVSATGQPAEPGAGPEHDTILRLCTVPRSVAEVAALLSVPLGVARVVLGDMAEAGSIVVHRTAGTAAGTPDLVLMQRVLTCLQRL